VSSADVDGNPGTSRDRPFKTIARARDNIRFGKFNQNMQANFTIYLRGKRKRSAVHPLMAPGASPHFRMLLGLSAAWLSRAASFVVAKRPPRMPS